MLLCLPRYYDCFIDPEFAIIGTIKPTSHGYRDTRFAYPGKDIFLTYEDDRRNINTNGDIRMVRSWQYTYHDTCITIRVSLCETGLKVNMRMVRS